MNRACDGYPLFFLLLVNLYLTNWQPALAGSEPTTKSFTRTSGREKNGKSFYEHCAGVLNTENMQKFMSFALPINNYNLTG